MAVGASHNGGHNDFALARYEGGVFGNTDPHATDDNNSSDENTQLTVAAPGLMGNDTDDDTGDTFTVTAVNGQASAVGSTITLASGARLLVNADGSYSYDPSGQFESLGAGATAVDTFQYTITDIHGDSDSATVFITITGVNDAPVANNDSATVAEDSTNNAIDVLANDSSARMPARR